MLYFLLLILGIFSPPLHAMQACWTQADRPHAMGQAIDFNDARTVRSIHTNKNLRKRALLQAAANGIVEILRVILTLEIDADSTSQALAYACQEGQLAAVKLLLNSPVDASGKSNALRDAVCKGHPKIVQLLLLYDADLLYEEKHLDLHRLRFGYNSTLEFDDENKTAKISLTGAPNYVSGQPTTVEDLLIYSVYKPVIESEAATLAFKRIFTVLCLFERLRFLPRDIRYQILSSGMLAIDTYNAFLFKKLQHQVWEPHLLKKLLFSDKVPVLFLKRLLLFLHERSNNELIRRMTLCQATSNSPYNETNAMSWKLIGDISTARLKHLSSLSGIEIKQTQPLHAEFIYR